jgi:predicted transcriptional regulator
MSEVRIHVSNMDAFFENATRAGARIDAGDFSLQPGEIAFESMDLLLKVLTANRWRLLRALKAAGTSSIRQLAHSLKRDYRGVHADVVALAEVGLVEKTAEGLVKVPWDRITAEMAITEAA